MNTDIRLQLSFKDHRKRKKLARRLGPEAVLALIDLWLATAENNPSGTLAGMDAEDIVIDAGWAGDAQEFVAVLDDVGFLDLGIDGVYSLHDWLEHNPWAATASDRKNQQRFKIMARHFPEIYKELRSKGITEVTAEEYRRYTSGKEKATAGIPDDTGGIPDDTDANTLFHSHSHSQFHSHSQREEKDDSAQDEKEPKPKAKDKEKGKGKGRADLIEEQAREVLTHLNSITGSKFRTFGNIKARLRGGATVEECKAVLDFKKQDKDFDNGKYLNHTTPFRPDHFDRYLQQALAAEREKNSAGTESGQWPTTENCWAEKAEDDDLSAARAV